MNKHGIFNLVILSVAVCLVQIQFSNGADANIKQKKDGGSLDALRDAIKGTLENMDPQELTQKPDMKKLLGKVVNNMDWEALGIKGLDSNTLKMALSLNNMKKKNPDAFAFEDTEDFPDFPDMPELSGMPDLSLLFEQFEKKETPKSKSETKESKTKPKIQIPSGKPAQALPNILNMAGLDMGSLLNFGNLLNTKKDSPDNPLSGIHSIIEVGQTVANIRREGRRSVCLSHNGYSVSKSIQDSEICLERFPFICSDPDLYNTCNVALVEKKREESLERSKRVLKALGKAMGSMSTLGLKIPAVF